MTWEKGECDIEVYTVFPREKDWKDIDSHKASDRVIGYLRNTGRLKYGTHRKS